MVTIMEVNKEALAGRSLPASNHPKFIHEY